MRKISHWTPRYIADRLMEMSFQKRNPHAPWLAADAIKALQTYLRPSDVAAEFGSGRSTLWFAKRVGSLTSVEHHIEWAERVRKDLDTAGISNVKYLRVEPDHEQNSADSEYVRVATGFDDCSLDFCLVDGVQRSQVAKAVLSKIKPHGLLVIDNVNWYLPSETNSPASRSLSAGPADAVWAEVWRDVKDWRRIWFSSGVTDTAFFFKPV